MKPPCCSVVVPTYNTLSHLPAALASVMAQNVEDIEVLVCDDGSNDGTAQWLAKVAAKMPNLKIFEGGGLGPAHARNILISVANSNLIAFLDADDFWWPNKLKNEIEFHRREPRIALTFTDYLHVDPNGRLYGTAFDYWRPQFIDRSRDGFIRLEHPLENLLSINVIGTSCCVAKREYLQNANGFSTHLASAEDWDLWLRLAERNDVAVSASVTMSYLMRTGGETSNRKARINAMQSIIQTYAFADIPPHKRRMAQSRVSTAIAEFESIKGNNFNAFLGAFHALRLYPTCRNAWFALVCLQQSMLAFQKP